jgi:hypothetical protein
VTGHIIFVDSLGLVPQSQTANKRTKSWTRPHGTTSSSRTESSSTTTL